MTRKMQLNHQVMKEAKSAKTFAPSYSGEVGYSEPRDDFDEPRNRHERRLHSALHKRKQHKRKIPQ